MHFQPGFPLKQQLHFVGKVMAVHERVLLKQSLNEPIALGGDFGGKGSPMDAPLCAELARLTGRSVKLVLRYSEDLVGTESRHPATFRVRVGCDAPETETG